jgi:hypothetical protein
MADEYQLNDLKRRLSNADANWPNDSFAVRRLAKEIARALPESGTPANACNASSRVLYDYSIGKVQRPDSVLKTLDKPAYDGLAKLVPDLLQRASENPDFRQCVARYYGRQPIKNTNFVITVPDYKNA